MKRNTRFQTIAAIAAALIIGVLLLAPAGGAAAEDAAALLPAGEAAPKFESVDIDGKAFSLEEELARGPVFLVFWSIF